MALLQDYGLVFDAVICLLLVVAIGYAGALNRKLTQLRDAKRDMEKLFAEFASATNEAQGGLMALKEGSGTAGQALAKNVSDACRLADEMAFLVKKGNEIADRLEVQVAASRKASQTAAPLRAEMPQAPQTRASSPQPSQPRPSEPRVPETLGAAALESGALDAVKARAQGLADGLAAKEGAPRGIAKLAKRKLSEADSELMRTLQAIR
jgi:hypothetical protein